MIAKVLAWLLLSFTSFSFGEPTKLVSPYKLFTSNYSMDNGIISSEEPHILVTLDWAARHRIKEDTSGMKLPGPVLRVGCFHYPPFTFRTELDDGSAEYRGLDVSLATVVAKSLGLRPEFRTPTDGRAWGIVYANGTSNGLMHDVIAGTVDVGMAGYFYYHKRTPFSHPSDFYMTDNYCFTRMKPGPMPQWQAVIRPFHWEVWATTFASILASILFLALDTGMDQTFIMQKSEVVLTSLAFYIGQSLGWKTERYSMQ